MEDELVVLALGEAVLFAVLLALLLGHALWHGARLRREAPRLKRVASTLQAAVKGNAPDRDSLAEVADLSPTAQIDAFAPLAENLTGIQAKRLATVAAEVGLLDKATHWCLSPRWGQRLRGARVLTLLGGGQDVMADLLDDPRAEVRAEAAHWAGAQGDIGSIDRLLKTLGDPVAICRFTVKDSLLRLGRPVIEPLLSHLREADELSASEALDLAAGVADARFLGPALEYCGASEASVRALAATLTGSIGGAQATAALTGLLHDRDPDVRASAARALGRLHHWPAAGALANCLNDSSWDVRLAAGLGLRGFGSPGVLLLKRALTSHDRFARDMARQLLDLPGE